MILTQTLVLIKQRAAIWVQGGNSHWPKGPLSDYFSTALLRFLPFICGKYTKGNLNSFCKKVWIHRKTNLVMLQRSPYSVKRLRASASQVLAYRNRRILLTDHAPTYSTERLVNGLKHAKITRCEVEWIPCIRKSLQAELGPFSLLPRAFFFLALSCGKRALEAGKAQHLGLIVGCKRF